MSKIRSAETGEEAEAPRPVHFSETPEFQAAVAAASQLAVANVKAEVHAEFAKTIDAVKESRGESAGAGDLQDIFRQLALSIAEISDGDQGRKRTPPAELAKRAHAKAQMDAVILKHSRKAADYLATTGSKEPAEEAPTYLMLAKSYLGDELINPFKVDDATKKPYPVSIVWMGPPNDSMSPLNDAAKEIFGFFKRSIGDDPPPIDAPVSHTDGWVTAGGAVILGMNGTPVSMSEKRGLPDPDTMARSYQRGPGVFDPRRDRINILGTVAEAARQTGSPDAPRRGV